MTLPRRTAALWNGSEGIIGIFHREGLGMRMQNAFQKTFMEGNENVVLIGTDCPDITLELVDEGFRRLEQTDSVIGPSIDGGYYLIGFTTKGFLPAAFEKIPLGSGNVFHETLSNMKRAGRHCHILPQWHDIDTALDLARLVRMHSNGPFRNSRTMRFLLSRPELMKKLKGENNG